MGNRARKKVFTKRVRSSVTHRASHAVADDRPTEESVFRSLLDSLNVGVALVTEEGKILHANTRFAEMLGAEDGEGLAGRLLRKYVPGGAGSTLFVSLQAACG